MTDIVYCMRLYVSAHSIFCSRSSHLLKYCKDLYLDFKIEYRITHRTYMDVMGHHGEYVGENLHNLIH